MESNGLGKDVTGEIKEPTTFGKLLGTEFVHLTVGSGDSSKKFAIHKSILCRIAPYFEKMFNGGFKESETLSATFPEDDPETFELFFSWVYQKSIHTEVDFMVFREDLTALFKLFSFAEKYLLPKLEDHLMDCMIESFNYRQSGPGPEDMALAYASTSKGSKLRLFIARVYVHLTLDYTHYDMEQTVWSSEEMLNIVKCDDDLWHDTFLMMRVDRIVFSDPLYTQRCVYHRHPEGEACPNTIYALDRPTRETKGSKRMPPMIDEDTADLFCDLIPSSGFW